jgi:hypothetical protein
MRKKILAVILLALGMIIVPVGAANAAGPWAYVFTFLDSNYQGGIIGEHDYTLSHDCSGIERTWFYLTAYETNNISSVQFQPANYPSVVPHCNLIGVRDRNNQEWWQCTNASARGIYWFGPDGVGGTYNDNTYIVWTQYLASCELNY